MDILDEIKQKLLSGKKPKELIKEGYAKSSVYSVARKVRNVQTGNSRPNVDDELAELRLRKETVKLEKEIAELEAAKDRLPDRVDSLESSLEWLPERVVRLEAKLEEDIQELRDSVLEVWSSQALESLKKVECPRHGHTMGYVVKCKQCDYEVGLGW